MRYKLLIAIITLIAAFFPVNSSALNTDYYDFIVDGIAYHVLKGTTSPEVEVTYSDDSETDDNGYYGNNYKGLSSAEIPSTVSHDGTTYVVTAIGSDAFTKCSTLKSISIPKTVRTIGYNAFWECKSLTQISIPSSVTAIPSGAFYECTSLSHVSIPNSVTSIGGNAFEHCYSLSRIEIPNSVTSIGKKAFNDTPWFNNQPDGLVYINNVAYKYKGKIPENTVLTLRDGTISISDNCFADCYGLANVNIPNTVVSIGYGAFEGTSWFNNQPSGLIYLNKVAYYYKGKMPENTVITLRDGIVSISPLCFSHQSGLSEVIIPKTVTTIGWYAFSDCSGLTRLTIPSSMTHIGNNAFYNCGSLSSVTFDGCVSFIADNAFILCEKLSEVHITDLAKWCENEFEGWFSNPISYAKQIIVDGEVVTDLSIPNTVTAIGNFAFADCSSLKSITIPNSVTLIGQCAFSGCDGLTSITLPESVTFIGEGAFSHCKNLESVKIPSTVRSIRDGAFNQCKKLSDVYITDLAEWCNIDFEDRYSNPLSNAMGFSRSATNHIYLDDVEITDLNIPNTVTVIKSYTFDHCRGLKSITIPNSVISIGTCAFGNCSSLREIRSLIEDVSKVKMGEIVFQHFPSSCVLKVPKGTKKAYKNASQWNEFSKIQ